MLPKIIPGLLCLLVAGLALAQATPEEMKQQPTPEMNHVTGAVKSISADSLVVTADEKDWTFIVDEDTTVVAKGASHTSRRAARTEETTMITDFVKVEQKVAVGYIEKDGKFTAKQVRRVN
jgi:hypothetical protein